MDAQTPEFSCQAVSPAHRVALVELYTSEGCSSCPPAERWLGQAWPQARFDQAIPLALHVNYWDYIGWKDPYADPRFTDRQREYARLRNSSTVYTPQVVLQGRDERAWPAGLNAKVRAINQQPAAWNLKVSAQTGSDQLRLYLQADPVAALSGTAPPKAFVALTYSGLVSKVTRGENAGETLHHDHVVRAFSGPIELNAGNGRAVTQLPIPQGPANVQRQVVAWLETAPGTIAQATGCQLRAR
jgi:hypothetical protein